MEPGNRSESKQQVTPGSHTIDSVNQLKTQSSDHTYAVVLKSKTASSAADGPGWMVSEEVFENAFLAFRFSSGYAFEGNH